MFFVQGCVHEGKGLEKISFSTVFFPVGEKSVFSGDVAVFYMVLGAKIH